MSADRGTPLRVVVADDHPFYRKGPARSLRACGIDVVAEAPNGEAAIRAFEETAPDVVVMDLKMPGMSGLEATRLLTRRDARCRVLVLTVSAEDTDVTDAILAGASGYVLKERPVDEVVDGIKAAASGCSTISSKIAVLLVRRLFEPGGVEVDLSGVPLSTLDRRMLDGIGRGLDDRELAQTLGITAAAVEAQAAGMIASLEAADLIAPALRAYRRRHG
jgi:DNA-binding NarL/FixJ family response regulator